MIVAMGVEEEEEEEVTLGEETETEAVVEVDMVAAETIEEAVAEGMTVEVEDMVAEDMVAEEKENLKTGEENSVGNEASPGLRSRSRVSKEIKMDSIILMT